MLIILHRIFYLTGMVIAVIEVYITLFLSEIEIEIFNTSAVGFTLNTIMGLFLIYYIICLCYALFRLVVNKQENKFLWFIALIAVVFLGVFIYLERYVFIRSKIITSQTSKKYEELLLQEIQVDRYLPRLMLKRGGAYVIDYGIYYLFLFAYFFLFGEKTASGLQVQGPFHIAFLFIIWSLWIPWNESRKGQTFGKKIMKIVVVNNTGSVPLFKQCFKRHILDVIDIIFFSIVPILSTSEKEIPRRLGDYFAKTWVISKTI